SHSEALPPLLSVPRPPPGTIRRAGACSLEFRPKQNQGAPGYLQLRLDSHLPIDRKRLLRLKASSPAFLLERSSLVSPVATLPCLDCRQTAKCNRLQRLKIRHCRLTKSGIGTDNERHPSPHPH